MPGAVEVLSLVSGVQEGLLVRARVRPASTNWLRAPWYPYERGGAMTVGRTIWFTALWWDDPGLGDRSHASTWRWLEHLAHEVGHLQQAERCGGSIAGRMRYVAHFVLQYGARAIRLKGDVHDGAPWELEADAGRQVLRRLLGAHPWRSGLVDALVQGDAPVVRAWCREHAAMAALLLQQHRAVHGPFQ